MSKQANPTLIGIFVAGAIALIVAGILIISGGKLLLTDKTNYVLYFKGSVKGLNIGSPVSFRGVNIGTVTDIQLVVNEEESDIPVSYTHLTLPTICFKCRSRWSPDH